MIELSSPIHRGFLVSTAILLCSAASPVGAGPADSNSLPQLTAGPDRIAVQPGATYLDGKFLGPLPAGPPVGFKWSKYSGPGEVTFSSDGQAATEARFSMTGRYVIQLSASRGHQQASATVEVVAEPPPPANHLQPLWPAPHQITSPFWSKRLKNIIVHWLPHCTAKLCDPENIDGSIDDFVQAGRILAGQPHDVHFRNRFSDWILFNLGESMCLALMVDPQGDQEIIAAQSAMRKMLDDWIPKILSAQEPDGYLLTRTTIRHRQRWSNIRDHEGYQAGYFLEFAIAHHLATGGKDRRLLDAALRVADCWARNIGPAPKKKWYDGHQGIEYALVKLARYLVSINEPAKSKDYMALARFLLDCRGGGKEYDQTHLPLSRQYAVVGHAVRAVYCYTAMADIAMETSDPDYRSATQSLWNNLVNRKYYVTGAVGSGETDEGFGPDYSLPNDGYGESCAACGEIFFQHRQQLAWHDARYADLLEETLYNGLLGGLDLQADNFTYTNPLDTAETRYPWHNCPCCVGNIPRTLLSLPVWAYSRSADALFVNLFFGSQVVVDRLAGTQVQIVQTTDYPWNGKVAITLKPSAPVKFSLHLRVPNRHPSTLYTPVPEVSNLLALSVNGQPVPPVIERGYAVINRTWIAGDKVEFELPLPVQRVTPDPRIAATAGRVALRRGPLIYNIESVDQDVEAVLNVDAPLTSAWRNELLDGVVVIQGAFGDGKPMLAIPHYARLNRGGRSLVWIKNH